MYFVIGREHSAALPELMTYYTIVTCCWEFKSQVELGWQVMAAFFGGRIAPNISCGPNTVLVNVATEGGLIASAFAEVYWKRSSRYQEGRSCAPGLMSLYSTLSNE